MIINRHENEEIDEGVRAMCADSENALSSDDARSKVEIGSSDKKTPAAPRFAKTSKEAKRTFGRVARGLCALSLCVVVALAALALARRDAMRGDAPVATNRSIAVVANNVDESKKIAVNEDAATLVTTATSETEPSEDSTVEIAFEPTSQKDFDESSADKPTS